MKFTFSVFIRPYFHRESGSRGLQLHSCSAMLKQMIVPSPKGCTIDSGKIHEVLVTVEVPDVLFPDSPQAQVLEGSGELVPPTPVNTEENS